MEKAELTLKNIYRIFTQRDYPVFSMGVLKERDRKGLTILKFWEEMILYEWKSGHYGKMIWQKDGARSRYSSELFNRRPQFPYYQPYLQEIISSLTASVYLQQIRLFMSFLAGKHYQMEPFRIKIIAFLKQIQKDDLFVSDDIHSFLSLYEKEVSLPQAFLDGWVLTALFLHAVAGPEMKESALASIRSQIQFHPAQLYRMMSQNTDRTKLIYLTIADSELTGKALSSLSFFGREKELFDLMELAGSGAKVLVSGIGGCGKTELLRQLLKEILRTEDYQSIGEIQYEGSLAESFARSFPDAAGSSAEERFHDILHTLNDPSIGKTILFIDNATVSESDRPFWKELSDIRASVIVSSRNREAEGFTTYSIEPLTTDAALLVLRSHYGKWLEKDEKAMLLEELYREELRHPLTLSIIGRAARYNQWTIPDILRKIEKGPAGIRWQEDQTEYHVQRICSQLYNERTLSRDEKEMIHLLSILPYGKYQADYLSRLQNGKISARNTIHTEDLLERLYLKGWLDSHSDGYSMHPLIAESFLHNGLKESDFPEMWTYLSSILPFLDICSLEDNLSQPPVHTYESHILIHAARCIRGDLSSRFLNLCLSSAWQILQASGEGPSLSSSLEELPSRCPDVTWQQKAMIQMMNCLHENYHVDSLKRCIDEGFQEEAESSLLIRLCLFAIPKLAEIDKERDYAKATVQKLQQQSESKQLLFLESFINWSQALDQGNPDDVILILSRLRSLYQELSGNQILSLLIQAWTNTVFFLFSQDQSIPEAEALYQAYQTQGFNLATAQIQILELRMTASYEDYHGNSEKAANCLTEILQILERTSGRRSRTYLISQNDLAYYLNRSGQIEEALDVYEAQIAHIDETLMNAGYYPMLLNNAGAAWFQTENYEMAEKRFLEASRLAKERNNELLVANTAYWLSRICRIKGDTTKEKDYLHKAFAFFFLRFGMQDKKSLYMAERIKELSADEQQK